MPEDSESTEVAEQPVKRKRGRPRKNPLPDPAPVEATEQPVKKKRGRPRLVLSDEQREQMDSPIRRRRQKKINLEGFEIDDWASRIISETTGSPAFVVKHEGKWYLTKDLEKGFEPPACDTPVQLLGEFMKAMGFIRFTNGEGQLETWKLTIL